MGSTSCIRQAVLIAIIISYAAPAHSFTLSNVPLHRNMASPSSTAVNNFFKDAFANDDSLGKAKNEGLSGGPKYNEQVTVNGKPINKIVVNQSISQVCNAARVKVPYNCQNGECGTCMVKINGRKVKACVSKVPSGKCAIETL